MGYGSTADDLPRHMRVVLTVPNAAAMAQNAEAVDLVSAIAPLDPPCAAPSAARVRYGCHLSRR